MWALSLTPPMRACFISAMVRSIAALALTCWSAMKSASESSGFFFGGRLFDVAPELAALPAFSLLIFVHRCFAEVGVHFGKSDRGASADEDQDQQAHEQEAQPIFGRIEDVGDAHGGADEEE